MLKLLHDLKPGQIFTLREEAGAVQYIRGEYSEEHHAYLCREKENERVLIYAPGSIEIFI